ncbi:hypothetical protein Drorol1_Dr00021053 [Drosera rotundifolia]
MAFLSFKVNSSSLSLFFTLLLCASSLAFFDANSIQTFSRFQSSDNRSETDRLSLLALKSQLYDPLKTLASWNSSLDHCIWRGVVCGRRHRRVTKLDLSSLSLVGTLSPSIGNLSFLHKVYLHDNAFLGQLPAEIGHLSRLRIFNASNNSFTGQIPANLSRCVNLVEFHMLSNQLEGTIPHQLGLLSKLQKLTLYGNRLTGDISVLVNLTSLERLSLSNNSFVGTIPDTIGRLEHLAFLGLGENNLSGRIPPSLYNLSALIYLRIDGNMLEGSLHQDIGLMLPRLHVAYFHYNSFSGLLPSSLSNLSKIQTLDLSNNNFSGEIPLNGESSSGLSKLNLYSNNLGFGKSDDLNFLKSFVNCSKLKILQFDDNNLGGELSSSVSNFSTSLICFTAGNNHIWGSIPSGLTKLINLMFLYLNNNQLTRTIPDGIGSLKNVNAVNFEKNKLTGHIPPSFGNLSMLSGLGLDQNAFEGRIPSTLGNCKYLQYLYLGGNRLTGVIPAELFTPDNSLLEVGLEGNQLKGVLPHEVGQLRNLVLLSVSSNELSGEIPESLGRCAGLRVLDMSNNSFEGAILESFSALGSLEQLDLSDNNFSGPIPGYFSHFPLYLLNFSFNDFEGEIPMGGVFANDSALFLEGNHGLCGGIVELRLPKCTLKEARPRSMNHRKLIMIISATCGAIGTASALLLIPYVKKKSRKNLTSAEAPLPQEQFLKMSYEMLLKATDGFLPANLIGMGYFGSVYKGIITISDATEVPIAVKVLDLQRRGSTKSFVTECEALTRIRHRNLVKIISACSSIDFKGDDFKALIYGFISNGSLDQWLYPGEGTGEQNRKFQEFGLLHRVNVAFDMASVLDYLHNGCVTAVVHCDIKPSNILLDDDMVAHLGDFGLSRIVTDMRDQTGSSSTVVKGTIGYAAPEYGLGSPILTEGDIYSFGIVLLELMIRKRPTDAMFDNGLSLHELAEMALLDQDHLTDIVDATLIEAEIGPTNLSYRAARRVEVEYHKRMACIASILHLGVACSMKSPNDRINIDEAVRRLKLVKDVQLGARAVSDLQIP